MTTFNFSNKICRFIRILIFNVYIDWNLEKRKTRIRMIVRKDILAPVSKWIHSWNVLKLSFRKRRLRTGKNPNTICTGNQSRIEKKNLCFEYFLGHEPKSVTFNNSSDGRNRRPLMASCRSLFRQINKTFRLRHVDGRRFKFLTVSVLAFISNFIGDCPTVCQRWRNLLIRRRGLKFKS